MGCLIFAGDFTEKSPVISGSFAKRDLQLEAFYASSPTCTQCSIFIDIQYTVELTFENFYSIRSRHISLNAVCAYVYMRACMYVLCTSDLSKEVKLLNARASMCARTHALF